MYLYVYYYLYIYFQYRNKWSENLKEDHISFVCFNLHRKTTLTEKTEKYKYQFIQKTNITR